ncbi:LysE family translocator [Chryseobacterium indologenes]|uniref:LysE family translocator n=1 Tax=Chryseobacterium indologenes TaxID=253 RepID=A0AAD1DVG3_CHRID|nr:LysE family translocator [Chryseobacterium indologenes]AZB17848.1 LysE family translocator [Chryseobacterium indologenes]QPQ52139.1 LysE family translocator [Chryseobacterium indologenes]SFI54122.1 Threonine/homoserine/homoserine lactone efflux protein [Chryseobacterium indologenes]SUX50734.1 Homoserine/homoserine lactone efflux protein [Chryseobacterium indologenes]GAE64045.1 putative amino acid efflux protein [Chryseobacterium indologenes NBRC 14944]
MIPLHDLPFFMLAALILAISPGPNMIYLISKSITQGKKSGFISLTGVICGFIFHIIMVSFGLTAVLLAVPFAYTVLKTAGTIYLLYLAYQAIKPKSRNIFEVDHTGTHDRPKKLFTVGFLTNVLNPKVAVFYLSFFPQFIKPGYGSVFTQSLELGIVQVILSFTVNFIIVLTAAKVATFFSNNPVWIRVQKWFMASVLTYLAIKMAFSKAK